MKLIYLSLSWVAGICLGTWAGSPWAAVAAIVGAVILAFLLRRRRALLVVCLLVLLGGILRFQSTVTVVDEGTLSFYNDAGIVQMRGLIGDDPETTATAVRLHLEAREIQVEGEWTEVSGAALVYAPRFPAPGYLSADASRDPPFYRYGDLVQVSGRLQAPPELESFDWREHLALRGIHSVVRHPDEMALLATGQGFEPREWLYGLRNRMSGSLDRALHEPQAALAQAILLGKRGTIPDGLRESLSRTGTAHIIAVSGLHLAIVGGMMLYVGVRVFGRRRPYYFMLTIAFIWAYAALTGMHPPVLRAAIMFSLWLLAEYVGRPRSAVPVLLFAAAIMIGIKPSIIREMSFQMSFAAMAGVTLLAPHFRSLGRRILRVAEERRGARTLLIDSLAITLGAYLATAPVIAYYFHNVSLVALPANLVALPALPFVIGAAAMVGVVGLFLAPVAGVLGWVAWLFMSFMIQVVEFFSGFGLASMEMEVGALEVGVYYAVVGGALWIASGRARSRLIAARTKAAVLALLAPVRKVPTKFVVLPLLLLAALVWAAAFRVPDAKLHVFFLDVGQGDAILLQKGQQQVLIDGGPDPERIALELGERLPFWDRTIELVILTHPEADHVTGLVEVLRRYEVGQVVTSGQVSETSVYAEWDRLIDEKGIKRSVARAGQTIMLADGMVLEVLHPRMAPLQSTSSDVNDNSVVARLVFRDFSLLLTGDISEAVERDLLENRPGVQSTALKVSHHGSDTSSSEEFLAGVDPQVAVVSSGADNPFGHPSREVMGRLADAVGEDSVYLTSGQGTIELTTDGERLWVRSERSAREP